MPMGSAMREPDVETDNIVDRANIFVSNFAGSF